MAINLLDPANLPSRPVITTHHFEHHAGFDGVAHSHAEGQLFVLWRGNAILRTPDASWLMTPNRPCWVPPEARHSALSRGPVAGVSLFLASSLCRGLPPRLVVFERHPLLLRLIERLAGSELPVERQSNLVAVLSDEIRDAEPDHLHLPMPKDRRLMTMAEMLAASPGDGRSLGDWGRLLAMSERSLVRHFRAETGLSVIEWRRRARVMRAAALLDGGAHVTEAALAVGYESVSAFSAVYRRLIGSSPATGRRRAGT